MLFSYLLSFYTITFSFLTAVFPFYFSFFFTISIFPSNRTLAEIFRSISFLKTWFLKEFWHLFISLADIRTLAACLLKDE